MSRARRQAKAEVIDWLLFYNRKRVTSTVGYVGPTVIEEIWRCQRKAMAA